MSECVSLHSVCASGKPAGSQCSGEDECACGSKCGPWQSDGLYCISTQPLAHLQPCDYSSRAQLCDTGLMCEQGVCVRADKYDLSKWNHALVNKPRIPIITLDFIRNYLAWKFPLKYDSRVDQCITLNFGSHMIKGLSMISMTLNSNFSWTEEKDNIYENIVHSNCFLIFIGGKYVQVLEEVVDLVENISRKMVLLPSGLFITEEKEDHKSIFSSIVTKYPLVHSYLCFSLSIAFKPKNIF